MKLITLIASHIDTKRRLHCLVKLVKNINDQIDYFDEFDVRISLSHNKKITLDEIKFLLSSVNTKGFTIHYQKEKLSQFEHYNFLIKTIDSDDTWVLFSDDDDEWAENRFAAYHYMINNIKENGQDAYDKTTSICYTNMKDKTATTYIGSYVDYCVPIKYLKIFFEHATPTQLAHKFCDCYFVKFICSYGIGKLKRAFCATEDILYNWNGPPSDKEGQKDIKEILKDNLDLYFAQYSKPTAVNWVKFCDIYCGNRLSNNKISPELKKYIVKLYLDNYENHIFADKNLPLYAT